MNKRFPILLSVVLGLVANNTLLYAANFTVNNTSDSGAGSLRQAILDANGNAGLDTIAFSIGGGGAQTITVLSPLPAITDPISLDATTQSGYAGVPLIALDGSALGNNGEGLDIHSGGCTVRGLCIHSFPGDGIRLLDGGTNLVAGNYIGTDTTGINPRGNRREGVRIEHSSGNTIGGTNAVDRNVIVDNTVHGVEIEKESEYNLVIGNLVGADGTGTNALGNGENGININASPNNIIGGPASGEGNVISGNLNDGVSLKGLTATGNVVQANLIGTDAGGTLPVGNGGDGVVIRVVANGNLIGGTGVGERNTIAFNGGAGVRVSGGVRNPLRRNSVHSNSGLGIDLGGDGVTANDSNDADGGGNDKQNFPVVISAESVGPNVSVVGYLRSTPGTAFDMEFFSSPTNDPSGFGEGQNLIGARTLTTDANGNISFTNVFGNPVSVGWFVTATATDPNGNSSEFSEAVVVTPFGAPPGTPEVKFSFPNSSTLEAPALFGIEVSLSVVPTQAVDVSYAVVGGTATPAVDYTLANGTLSIPAGIRSSNIFVALQSDTVYEGDETVVIELSAPVNATLGTRTNHTLTLLEDDPPPVIQFNIDNAAGPESIPSVPVQISLDQASDLDASVFILAGGGAAEGEGDDYAFTNAVYVIPAGSTNLAIALTINPDAAPEPDETVVLTMSSPIDATVGVNGNFTYTIQNDDGIPDLKIIKTAQPAGSLTLGERVTYTVFITNNTTITHTSVGATDLLPTGITYVASSAEVVTEVGSPETVRDEFGGSGFDGNDGTLNWANDWQELGEVDGPDQGDVRVREDGDTWSGPALRMGGNKVDLSGKGVVREVDLSEASDPTLSFTWKTSSDGGEDGGSSVTLSVSPDGGTNWVNLAYHQLDGATEESFSRFDLSAYAGASTRIRFLGDGVEGLDKVYFYADDIEVAYERLMATTNAGGVTMANALDQFSVDSFSNNNGSASWSDAWNEVGESDGSTAGDVDVQGGELRVHGALLQTRGAARNVDLSGAQKACLRFNYRTSGNLEEFGLFIDIVDVSVSASGGAPWTTLETFVGDGSGARVFNISPFISTSTTVRIETTLNTTMESGEYFYFDDVEIEFSTLFTNSATETIALAAGYELVPGGAMAITFDADVDDPLATGITDFTNVAMVVSDQQPAAKSASVTNPLAMVELAATSPLGAPSPPIGTNTFPSGSLVDLRIGGSPSPAGPGTRDRAVGWTGGGNVPSVGGTTNVTITLSTNSSINWAWQKEFELQVFTSGPGSVTDPGQWFKDGSNITVTATASNGYRFAGWTGDVSGGADTNNPVALAMDQPRAVTANFASLNVDLGLQKSVDDPVPDCGDAITFTIALTNSGPGVATGTEVTDLLPAGLLFQSAAPGQGVYDQVSGIWSVGTLAVGGTVSLGITVAVDTFPTCGASLVNTAAVTGVDQTDVNTGNDLRVQLVNIVDSTKPILTLPSDTTITCGDDTSPANTGNASATDNCDPDPAITFSDSVSGSCPAGEVITRTWTATDACGNTRNGDQTITVSALTHSITANAGGGGSIVPSGVVSVVDGNDKTFMFTPGDDHKIENIVVDGVPVGAVEEYKFTNVVADHTIAAFFAGGRFCEGADLASHLSQDERQEVRSDQPWGQTFSYTSGSGSYRLDTIALRLQAGTGPATPKVRVAIHESWSGPELGSDKDDTPDFVTEPEWSWFYFDMGGLVLNDGQTYIIRVSGEDTVGNVFVGNASSGAYANGEMLDSTGSPVLGKDLAFRVRQCGFADAVDLQLAESVDDTTPGCGDTITYTIGVTNKLTNSATGIKILDALPAGVTFVSAAATDGAYDSTSGVWSITRLDEDEYETLQLMAAVDPVAGCSNEIANVVTLNALDQADINSTNNVTQASITVLDTVDPVVTPPADVTIECDQDSSPSGTGAAGATDNCDIAPVVTFSDAHAGNCPEVITRTWTATDSCGNSSLAVQTITLEDTTSPVVTPPADVTIECDQDSTPTSTGSGSATDNCDPSPVVTFSDVRAGSCPEVITRSWTGTDACGNSITADQTITLDDTTDPVLTVPADVTIECDAASTPAATGTATATDNCDASPVVTFTDVTSSGGCPEAPVITRTWTATDSCGNAANGVQSITIQDTTAPVLSLPADATLECDQDTSPTTTGFATATDNCDAAPVVTFSDSAVTGACASESVITRSWTATDGCGNSATLDQTLTVVDTTNPVLSLPADVTIACDGDSSPTSTGTATASDNCDLAPVVAFSDSVTTGACAIESVIMRSWTATDACGNKAAGVQTITLEDTTNPVLSTPADVTVECGSDLSPASTGQATATDNCDAGPVVTFTDVSVGSCPQVITRNWTATDACDNQGTGLQVITVVDTTVPVLSVPADVIIGCGGDSSPAGTGTATATDTCDASPVVTFSDDTAPSPCPTPSVVTRSWTATDACGNATSLDQIITLLPIVGNASVTLEPRGARSDGAQWRLTAGPDTSYHDSGDVVTGLPGGNYTVEFTDAFGFVTPDPASLTVLDGQTAQLNQRYAVPDTVLVPGGTYQMGVVNGQGGCPVSVNSFLLDTKEVTVAEYQAFAIATSRSMPAQPWGDATLPVVNVSHADAQAYAAWRGKRLPTEAEWEYAARGGLPDALYPWGDAITPADANYDLNELQPTEAGHYVANGFALFDVAGNVWEWTADWFGDSLPCGLTNPQGPVAGTDRVIRGGSWATKAELARCAHRGLEGPDSTFSDVGFRCAQSAPNLSLLESEFSVTEDGGSAVVTVALSGGHAVDVRVDYTTQNGSALAGGDYTASSGTLVWPAGDNTERLIPIPITDDPAFENDESFSLQLSNPDQAELLGPHTATITILDDLRADLRLFKQPGIQQVTSGTDIVFTIVVSNAGDVTLSDVIVTDAPYPQCDAPITPAMRPGETLVYTCAVNNVTSTFFNTITATSLDPLLTPVHAESEAIVVVVPPGGDPVFTRSMPYWASTPGEWPIVTVSAGGVLYEQAEAIGLMLADAAGDVSILVAQELMAAQLNIANGAEMTDVAATVPAAETWLHDNPVGSRPQGTERIDGIALYQALRDYNNGVTGPGAFPTGELDFDGDIVCDVAVYWPGTGDWFIQESFDLAVRTQNWGWSAARPVPGDYDADGITDVAVYHQAAGDWYIQLSGTRQLRQQNWGWFDAIPVPADYDGDGRTDIAVWHPAAGNWYIEKSTDGSVWRANWGWSAVVPVPGDYTGDGRDDIAVYYPGSGTWYIRASEDGALSVFNWGWHATVPVPADYDGDGRTDIAVWHPATGDWYIRNSADNSLFRTRWGWSAVVPVPADYDGDQKADIAVWHPATGDWYIRRSSDGSLRRQNWGWSAVMPVLVQYQVNRVLGLLP